MDDAIESTQAVIDQLGLVKRAVMAELLTRGLPGRHTRFKPTPAGTVPESWSLGRVGDLGEVKLGRMKSPVYTEGRMRPYLRVANVLDDEIATDDVLSMPFQQIIEDRKAKRIDAAQALLRFEAVKAELRNETGTAERLGLTDTGLAIYGLITEPAPMKVGEPPRGGYRVDESRKELATLLEEQLEPQVGIVDWVH